MKKFFYRVNNNESVITIATTLNVAVSRLISLNNLKTDVCEGDLLYVESLDDCLTYTVLPFESAEDIARKFNVDKNGIIEINKTDLFYGGQRILIDKTAF